MLFGEHFELALVFFCLVKSNIITIPHKSKCNISHGKDFTTIIITIIDVLIKKRTFSAVFGYTMKILVV